MARAIRSLRERAGPNGKKISTLAAAANLGASRQTWEKYENAKADVVLRQDVQNDIARALGVTRADLMLEYERVLNPGGGYRGSSDMDPRGPGSVLEFPQANIRRLVLQDDNLRPWANSGTVIVYDLEQWPRADEGCVIETQDGKRLVKIFLRADDETFHVAELSPARRELPISRDGAQAYRVVARLT